MFVMMILISPVLVSAQSSGWAGLVHCGNEVVMVGDSKVLKNECTFKDFIIMINRIISFILVYMAVPISAIMFAYAGVILVTGGDESASAKTKAKSIFTNAVIGLVLVAGAFLIVKTLLSILGYNQGSWIGF